MTTLTPQQHFLRISLFKDANAIRDYLDGMSIEDKIHLLPLIRSLPILQKNTPAAQPFFDILDHEEEYWIKSFADFFRSLASDVDEDVSLNDLTESERARLRKIINDLLKLRKKMLMLQTFFSDLMSIEKSVLYDLLCKIKETPYATVEDEIPQLADVLLSVSAGTPRTLYGHIDSLLKLIIGNNLKDVSRIFDDYIKGLSIQEKDRLLCLIEMAIDMGYERKSVSDYMEKLDCKEKMWLKNLGEEINKRGPVIHPFSSNNLTQEQADEIYRKLVILIHAAMEKSLANGKRLVIVVGDVHSDRTALMFMHMIQQICVRLGVRNIGVEHDGQRSRSSYMNTIRNFPDFIERTLFQARLKSHCVDLNEHNAGTAESGKRPNFDFILWEMIFNKMFRDVRYFHNDKFSSLAKENMGKKEFLYGMREYSMVLQLFENMRRKIDYRKNDFNFLTFVGAFHLPMLS